MGSHPDLDPTRDTGSTTLAEGDYTARLCRYPPGRTLPRHEHATTGVSVVLAGELEEDALGTSVTATALSVVVKPAGVAHRNRFGPRGARLLAVELSPRLLERFEVRPRALERWRWTHGGELAALAVDLLRAATAEGARGGALDDALAALLEALGAQAGPGPESGPPPGWLLEVRDRLHDELAALPPFHRLAQEAGVHRVHLAREFRRRFGCSATEYVRRLRVRAAADALASTQAPLAAVALDLGFADQSHLSRTFRGATGLPPGRFRALAGATSVQDGAGRPGIHWSVRPGRDPVGLPPPSTAGAPPCTSPTSCSPAPPA